MDRDSGSNGGRSDPPKRRRMTMYDKLEDARRRRQELMETEGRAAYPPIQPDIPEPTPQTPPRSRPRPAPEQDDSMRPISKRPPAPPPVAPVSRPERQVSQRPVSERPVSERSVTERPVSQRPISARTPDASTVNDPPRRRSSMRPERAEDPFISPEVAAASLTPALDEPKGRETTAPLLRPSVSHSEMEYSDKVPPRSSQPVRKRRLGFLWSGVLVTGLSIGALFFLDEDTALNVPLFNTTDEVVAEDAAPASEAPVLGETPVAVEEPVIEVPVAEAAPVADETPVAEETPLATETPTEDSTAAEEPIVEAPVVAETPVPLPDTTIQEPSAAPAPAPENADAIASVSPAANGFAIPRVFRLRFSSPEIETQNFAASRLTTVTRQTAMTLATVVAVPDAVLPIQAQVPDFTTPIQIPAIVPPVSLATVPPQRPGAPAVEEPIEETAEPVTDIAPLDVTSEPVVAEVAPEPVETPATPQPPAESTTAEVAPPEPISGIDVTLHVPNRVSRLDANALIAQARDAGFVVDQTRPAGFTISRTNIRYYHAANAENAQVLADAVDGELRNFTSFRPSPALGTIEIWMAGSAPSQPAPAPQPETPALSDDDLNALQLDIERTLETLNDN